MNIICSLIKFLYKAMMTVFVIEWLHLFLDNVFIIAILTIGYVFINVYDFIKEVDDLNGQMEKSS